MESRRRSACTTLIRKCPKGNKPFGRFNITIAPLEYSYLRCSQDSPWFREANSPFDVFASSTVPSVARVQNSPNAALLYLVCHVAPPFRDQ